MNKFTTRKSTNGITIIALVITIIVLLILAGVSIAMLTGKNGILTQAQNAKIATETKNAEEKVNLAVKAAMLKSKKGKLDADKLVTEVKTNYGGTAIKSENGFPVNVTIDGKSFAVDENGTVTSLESTLPTSEGDIQDTLIDLSWDELKQASSKIASSGISADTVSLKVKVGDKIKTLALGNYKVVKYDGVDKKVRIIGFNHDEKSDGIKAGITFDFETCLANSAINSNYDTTGGWGASEIKTNMTTYLGKLKIEDGTTPLSKYVVEVKKNYIKNNSSANSVQTDNTDKLWLLASSEIYKQNSDTDTKYGYAITKEGEQYKYYKIATNGITYNFNNPKLVKYSTYTASDNSSSQTCWWWIRSPHYNYSNDFCYVNGDGNSGSGYANGSCSVAPGFCI